MFCNLLSHTEYGQSLKEQNRECEKLSRALEKQQDSSLKKWNALNDTLHKKCEEYEATVTKLDTKGKELSTAVKTLRELSITKTLSS